MESSQGATGPDHSCGEEPNAVRESQADIPLENKPLLVPTNFLLESNRAFEYALHLGAISNRSVILLHVLSESEKEDEARARLQEQAASVDDTDVPVYQILKKGGLSESIHQVAQENEVEYIVLGSRDFRTMETMKRSDTLQLIKCGYIPYIVVQDEPDCEPIRNVVCPIDFTDENRGKYEWLDHLCTHHSPTFHLVMPAVNEPELEDRVEQNLELVSDILSQRSASFEEHQVEGHAEFSEEIFEVVDNVDADLIIISSMRDPRQNDRYMLEPHERKILMQAANIPVMIINPAI